MVVEVVEEVIVVEEKVEVADSGYQWHQLLRLAMVTTKTNIILRLYTKRWLISNILVLTSFLSHQEKSFFVPRCTILSQLLSMSNVA